MGYDTLHSCTAGGLMTTPHRTEEHKQKGASWAFSNQYIDVIYNIVSVLP
jgi:hypothetical protein